MIKCTLCNAAYVPNTIFCNECGHFLLEDHQRATEQMDPRNLIWLEKPVNSARNFPADPLVSPAVIRLKIGATEKELRIQLDKPIHIGRIDPGSDVFPDLDLTDYDPQAKVVSRRHARLFDQKNMIMVEDLGSVNGTYLNGKRLPAFFPETLSDGDHLRLGSLLMQVSVVG